MAEVERIRTIATDGGSADRQRAVREAALADGGDPEEAMRAVVSHLADEFLAGT